MAAIRERIIGHVRDKKVPSVSLAVIKNGEIIWEEAFGLADIANGIEATPRTVYPIASATKPFTATAIMILSDRGLVDLDRPVGAYLPRGSLRAFEGDAADATVRRVLHHTSGLPMFWSFYYEGASRRKPAFETTLRHYGILVSRPGEDYNYTNLGYALLENVIERVSGKSYPEFMAAEVFGPLGLARTAVLTSLTGGLDVAKKYGPSLASVPFCDHGTRGASAINATAHDLALFLLLHLGRLQPGQNQILQPRSIAMMQTDRDPDVRGSSYALGWETGQRFGYRVVTHGGAMDGCRAHLAMIPSEGLGVAVLINGENLPSIQVCDGIFAALLPAYARAMGAGSAGRAGSAAQADFRPSEALIGTWEGPIKTFEGDIPVRLVIGADGRVEICRTGATGAPGEVRSPLKTPTFNGRVFVVHFPEVFATSDAAAPSHRTVLGLHVGTDQLYGEANMIASDMSYSYPSYVSLRRTREK